LARLTKYYRPHKVDTLSVLIPLHTSVVSHEVSRFSLANHRHQVNGVDLSSRSLSPSYRVFSYNSNPSPINRRDDSLRFLLPYNTSKTCESSFRLRLQGLFTLLTPLSSHTLRTLFQIRAFRDSSFRVFFPTKIRTPFEARTLLPLFSTIQSRGSKCLPRFQSFTPFVEP